jgi:hypothetical protein
MRLVYSLFLLASLTATALEVAGANFPDTLASGTSKLILNGVGLRSATFLGIKVYAGGLYLESKSQSPEVILNSKQHKRVDLEFLRDVSAEDIRDAWKKSFEKSCGACADYKAFIDELLPKLSDMKKGDRMTYTFVPDGLIRLEVKGQEIFKQNSEGFTKVVLSSWIGPHPPNEGLKRGMLGL